MPPAAAKLSFRAVVFDMDGVVTRTADLHAAAWKELFDDYLRARADRGAGMFEPFDAKGDYLAYVDGKPRQEGARSFLAARGITLPDGSPDDPPDAETIYALARRKDELFERRLQRRGVAVFDSTTALIHVLRSRAVATAVVTSSRHGREVLQSAHVTALFDVILDGTDAARLELKGKPDPDIFLAAAEHLKLAPRQCIVIEDAAAGVMAGRHGGFGLVIGVDRGGNRQALMRSGADIVVADLGEVDVDALDRRFRNRTSASPREPEDAWRVEQEGFDPAREHEMESLFTVGNGYLGVRGSLDMPLPGSQADLFVAGIYDRKQPALPYSELEFLTARRDEYAYAERVPLPFPYRLRVSVGGRTLDLVEGPWRELRRVLDLRHGGLQLFYLFEDKQGRRTAIETWRCASLAEPHLLLQEVTVTCENHDALVEIDTSLHDPDLADHDPHLRALVPESADDVELRAYATQASGYTVALASRARLSGESRDRVYVQAQGKAGVALRLRRCVAIHTNRHDADPIAAARARAQGFSWDAFDRARAAHEACWAEVWRSADVTIGGSVATTQALRFNAYHLRIAANRDPRTSIGARTLSGRAYEGHVFWDVEIFMLPYFVRTFPDIARSLLLYRYYTLDGARSRALSLGYRGACYAWESTVTGADATPRQIILKTSHKKIPIYTGHEQVHVTADIAFAVIRYFEATGDAAFMTEAGAEILFETARFWASRCVRKDDRYHIEAVTGPDEYHHTVNDNAYTNWMARFNLEHAGRMQRWLARQAPEIWKALRSKLAIADEEPALWAAVAEALYLPQANASGVIEQFEGYFELRDYVVPASERFHPPLRRLFESEKINGMQLIKQADVLMLPLLFPERFTREVLAANYRYYEPRTDHASSLSPAVHATLAARLGLPEQAQDYWRRGLWLDLSNTMGNGALGIHAASMAGAWQTLVYGLLGIHVGDDGPVVDREAGRRLPARWQSVELSLYHHGKRYPLRWTAGEEER
jgi:alpha,alpha-trehalose phosphorylase